MKLNPKEYTFGVEEGMFLGYQVNTKGIKICPDKVDAVLSLQSPKCLEDVQKLNGKLASLNSYLCSPLQKNKRSLSSTRGTSKGGVSAVLMMEREARQDANLLCQPSAKGPKKNYTAMEKLVLALVHASKRLRRYFQAHPIIVITYQPIKNILSNPEVAGRMQKWSIQLGEFGIHYRPKYLRKGQVLIRFIKEKTEEEGQNDSTKEEEPATRHGGLCSRTGHLVLTDAEQEIADSGKNRRPKPRSKCGLKTGSKPSKWDLHRKRNKHDQMISKGKSTVQYLPSVLNKASPKKQEQKSRCIKQNGIHQLCTSQQVEEEGDTWMTPIHEYLTDETLPAERNKARAIKRKSQRFIIINGILYKKSFLGLWLRCVGPSQANYVLREIHEGSCSMHAGTLTFVAKALRTSYYWPTMHKDARALIKACQECQVHKPVLRNPQEKLNPITSPWPFYKWGIDIAGPFPEGPDKVKFLIVAMDYFTKWIEAKPVATITGNQTNGLVERANRSLGEGIKARLGKDNKNWLEEISHVLWAHRTMVKSSNGDTPFSLTYGTEAVIPAEIGMPTFRTAEVNVAENNEALEINLELLEEKREQAAIREAKSKRQMEKYYRLKVRNAKLQPETWCTGATKQAV
ncbi:reverse transcriptase domain-containing protein [Tanacetum coccineum]